MKPVRRGGASATFAENRSGGGWAAGGIGPAAIGEFALVWATTTFFGLKIGGSYGYWWVGTAVTALFYLPRAVDWAAARLPRATELADASAAGEGSGEGPR